MSKIWLIIKREYFTRVRKKSFLLTTLLVPVVLIVFYAAIIAISVSGESETYRIAVVDEAGLFNGQPEGEENLRFSLIRNETQKSFKAKYKEQGYSSFLYVPVLQYDRPEGIVLHSPSAVSLSIKHKIERTVDQAIEIKRLGLAGIDPQQYKSINSDISIDNTIESEEGEKKSVAGVAYGISFAGGILIYMILLLYGTMVMRGVMEEKTNRIAEVVVSSVKPFQLMLGKIVGIGGVGLTQFAIWIILIGLLQLLVPLLFPAMFQQMSDGGNAGAAVPKTEMQGMVQTVMQGVNSLNIGLILFCFIFYFLGGYLLYASLFAAVGSVVSEDQQEAQQLVFPIIMPLILGFAIMAKAAIDPDSKLAVFGSLFPLTSPIVMMGRITYGVPAWQLLSSMLLLVLTFLLFTWLTAKVYRTGILMYGKKITWREISKWAFR